MAHFIVFFVATAVALAQASVIYQEHVLTNVKPEEVGAVEGIPFVVESNLPATLNNVALTAAQSILDRSPNLIVAAQQLVQTISSYDQTQSYNVAIEPAAYSVQSNYFAHYVVNRYNVFLYSVQCTV